MLAGMAGLGAGAVIGKLAGWDPWTSAILLAFGVQIAHEIWWRLRRPESALPEPQRAPGDPRYRM